MLFTNSRFLLSRGGIALGLLCGVFWTLGSISYNISVDNVGVTRSTPVKNMGVVLATFFGIFIFHEFSLTAYGLLSMVIIGSVLMSFAAIVIGKTGAPEHEKAFAYDLSLTEQERKKYLTRGYLHASLAGVYFSGFTIPMRIMMNEKYNGAEITFWMSVGAVLSMLIFYPLVKKRFLPRLPKLKDFYRANFSGILWVPGIIFSIYAMNQIPMSVSWPITNLSALVTMAFGIWFYREISFKVYRKEISLGVFIYLLGMFLLGDAVSIGHR